MLAGPKGLDEISASLEEADDLYESAHEDMSSSEDETATLTLGQLKLQAAKKKARKQLKAGASNTNPDIEDLGASMPALKAAKENQDSEEKKEMLSSLTRKALTKQGYRLIGSHSGVKTCRWTKAALRSRGFCYKASF
jgi:tRNA wybutosine-synthesizing protein 1